MSDRQGSKAPRFCAEPEARDDDLARRVIGAAIEVHRHLGPGFLESVYEEALAIELGLREIPFARQASLPVVYKAHVVGEGRADFVVGGSLVVEVKAVSSLMDVHTAQVISYLKSGRFHLGLLLNFREAVLRRGIKRVVWSPLQSEGQQGARDVQESYAACGSLVISRGNSTVALHAVEEDLDAIA